MDLALIGYFLRQRVTRSGWVSPYPEYPDANFPLGPPAEEVCSASSCLVKEISPWDVGLVGTRFSAYATAEEARSVVPPGRSAEFAVYAFALVQTLFVEGEEQPLEIEDQEVEPLPPSFVCLGYDAAELREGQCLGCSPLSCNGSWCQASINRYSLMDTEESARDLARRFSIEKPEPGPYCVVQIWREQTPDSTTSGIMAT